MTAEERRHKLAELLARHGFAELSLLVAEVGVSESTIRRDLSQLEEEGIVRRIHGGAVFVSDRFSALNYAVRESAAVLEKQAIGRAAAELVNDGETVLLDGGTTTFQVARHLMTRSLQVVTNSLPIANLLSSAAGVELIFVGGYIYPRTGVALGPITQQALTSLHVDKAVMGVAGIMEDALYNANLLMVEAEKQMMAGADEVIIVADHGKFGRRALAHLGGWDMIDRVVSDDGLEPQWKKLIEDTGTQVVIAGVETAGIDPRRAAASGGTG